MRSELVVHVHVFVALFCLPASLPFAAAASELRWSDAFPSGNIGPPSGSHEVHAAVVFDEDGPGGGPAVLFAAGTFSEAGGLPAEGIARWDGTRWSLVGLGVDGPVHALAVFDPDGTGPASAILVAGGEFTTAGGAPAANVAAWDGTEWSALQSGVGGTAPSVRALNVWDPDGPGPQNPILVVAGRFDQAGGQAAGGLATWDGASWGTLGSGTTGTVYAVSAYGSDLWVGGDFDDLDGSPIARLARYDGATWSSGGTVIGFAAEVRALATWDDGGGERLALGGNFDLIDATVARNVAAWDGTSFGALGSGLGTFSEFVEVLTAFDSDGSDETLWAGGDFGSGQMRCLARYDGAAWSGIGEFRRGTAGGFVRAVASFDADGAGGENPRLWIGGDFEKVDAVPTTRDACEWDGARVVPLGNGLVPAGFFLGTSASFDPDGSGPNPANLYVVGGVFPFGRVVWAGEYRVGTTGVVAWNGSEWTDPGFDADAPVTLMKALDLGSGPELYATGDFTEIGGVPANRIAKWDGSMWSALGAGIDLAAADLEVWDMDGTGPSPAVLVVSSAWGVYTWDGSAWSSHGDCCWLCNGSASLKAYDRDGSGPFTPLLFVAANTVDACTEMEWLCRFDGFTWTSFGTGYGFYIPDLESYDPDGAGPDDELLYIPIARDLGCGPPEGAPAPTLASSDGWSIQDVGLPDLGYGWEPGALAAIDLDGEGPEGEGLFAYNVTGAAELSRYDGSSWSVVGTAIRGTNLYSRFSDLAEHDPDGPGPAPPLLAALGDFHSLIVGGTGNLVSSGGIGLYGYDPDAATAVPNELPLPSAGTPVLAAGRAFPTPFRETVRVEFTLAREGIVTATVHDVAGRRVRRLVSALFPAGSHSVVWDGRDRRGRVSSAGVYFLRLEAHGESAAQRVVRVE